MQNVLSLEVENLKGVGPKLAQNLAKLNIKTLADLLYHFPTKYLDKTRVVSAVDAKVGTSVVLEAEIVTKVIISKPKKSLTVTVKDKDTRLALRFFFFSKEQVDKFKPGLKIRVFGEIRIFQGIKQIVHPEYTILTPGICIPVEDKLTPVYPATKGVSQKLLANLVKNALHLIEPFKHTLSLWPPTIAKEHDFSDNFAIIKQLHFPETSISLTALNSFSLEIQQQLALEEMVAQNIALRKQRQVTKVHKSYPLQVDLALKDKLQTNLGFALTNAQINAIQVIEQDLAKAVPMARLIQGDVGSGKTLVAVFAALVAIANGLQVAFMAPTEILAQQHYTNIQKLLSPLGIEVLFLVGKLSSSQKNAVLAKLANSPANLVIGTHALFQEKVVFNKLGLVIIDEQHRFGVQQRLLLQAKAQQHAMPHQLALTATPIPRSLAMVLYADLDHTVIDELPPGRESITTLLMSNARRGEVLQRVFSACEAGAQAYWVCPLIEESQNFDFAAANKLYSELCDKLPTLNIALLHGKMKGADKEQVMLDFSQNKIHILVATTVIEVGVDVPNASLMLIENPERLGLAQLHQLRGRVGRGSSKSYCVLMYDIAASAQAKAKLQIIRDHQDGFKIAEEDLKSRGPGEVFGIRQTGIISFKIANIVRDQKLLPKVAKLSEVLLNEYPAVATKFVQRWISHSQDYAKV